jgi:lantibiotic modifying enzyme
MTELAAPPAPFLQAAIDAARWIRSTARETEHGLVWRPDPDQPEREATISSPGTIYSGNAGIVLFFLELARVTGDASYLADARRGADDIAANWREVAAFQGAFSAPNGNFDFFTGLSGTAFTLAHVWQRTGDTTYRDTALDITRHIAVAAQPAGSGVEWIGSPTIGMGDGSVVLYLLWAAQQFDELDFRDLAVLAGHRILETAQPDPRGGLKWLNPHIQLFIPVEGVYLPNFELGTAGVAYVLARLYAESSNPAFLAAAREGANHVQALATTDDDAALVFYREPDLTDLYYLGYCHGPVGTARLFYQLHRITGDLSYLDWTERFARGISQSGVPERETPGLWNVVCQCCGTAGILDFFTSLWIATKRPEHLAYAQRVARETLTRESDPDGHGARWYQAWTRVKPDDLAAETGYMIGAAGVGSALLHLHLAELGHFEAILFPDNPFPQTETTRSG